MPTILNVVLLCLGGVVAAILVWWSLVIDANRREGIEREELGLAFHDRLLNSAARHPLVAVMSIIVASLVFVALITGNLDKLIKLAEAVGLLGFIVLLALGVFGS